MSADVRPYDPNCVRRTYVQKSARVSHPRLSQLAI